MNSQKVFCLKCNKDLSEVRNLISCECGGRDFIFGKTIIRRSDRFSCNCGNSEFKRISHMNMNPTYITTYECTKCNATVGKEIYYESPYYEGW